MKKRRTEVQNSCLAEFEAETGAEQGVRQAPAAAERVHLAPADRALNRVVVGRGEKVMRHQLR